MLSTRQFNWRAFWWRIALIPAFPISLVVCARVTPNEAVGQALMTVMWYVIAFAAMRNCPKTWWRE